MNPPINALYGQNYSYDPVSDGYVDQSTSDVVGKMNALYSGPGGALRSLRNQIQENPDASISMRNMLRSGLGTAANWLQGTPEIGPDTLAPLGLGAVGTGLANALALTSRYWHIAKKTLMADNAKGSAPGTVINSLDMSEAARMARAKEQGFDTGTPWYHGTEADPFDQFKLGLSGASAANGRPGLSDDFVTFASSRKHAENYGDTESYFTRGKIKEADIAGEMEDWARQNGYRSAQKHIDDVYGGDLYTAANLDDRLRDLATAAKREGFDGARLSFGDLRGGDGVHGSVQMMFDPRNIRSPQAAFDPARRDSAMLLAADNAKGSTPGVVVNSLDMSQEARLARAKEQGFDTETPLYHGTNKQFDEFDPQRADRMHDTPAIWLTPSREQADTFATPPAWVQGEGRVIDTVIRPGRQFEYDADGGRFHADRFSEVLRSARGDGYDSVKFRNVMDDASTPADQIAIFDPSRIRSPQAAFDPSHRDSANLLASSPSASAPGLAANSTQQGTDSAVTDILRKYGLLAE